MWTVLVHNRIQYLYKTVAACTVVFLLLSLLPLHMVAAEEPVEQPVEESAPEPESESSEEPEAAPDGESDGETVIETGDATAGSQTINEVNTNETTTGSEDTEDPETTEEDVVEDPDTDDEVIETATTTESIETPPEPETDEMGTSTIAVENTNAATTTTEAAVTADTGENTATGGDGHSIIETGNAVAYADVLNVVNTNITNSDGVVSFVNDVLGYEHFDIRSDFEHIFDSLNTSQSTPGCGLSVCGDDSVHYTVSNDNHAVINNDISVIANTGGNYGSGETSWIGTGDAYASANVVNVANTNITDSNYLLMVFNNFDSYSGDIVLPNSDFFSELFHSRRSVGNINVENHNRAAVTNTVDVVADTGNNVAADGGHITTGHASGRSSVDNMINTNLFAGSSFSMLIRVHGQWEGDIFGLPEHIGWSRTGDGVRLYSTGESDGTTDGPYADSVTNTNTAVINNNVEVYALTGDNEIDAEDTAEITTGNANADATILNVANTNVIGSNWSNLVFNIYGNWGGNLTFGQSDLWLGVRADSTDNPIMPGSEISYTYTVFNRGDVAATDVTLSSAFNPNSLEFASSSESVGDTATHHSWNLGTIGAGETREFTYLAEAGTSLPHIGPTPVPLEATVTSYEPDGDYSDNTDEVMVYVGASPRERDPRNVTFASKVGIEKTADREIAAPGDVVDYQITFENRGGQLYDAILYDTLIDPDGNILVEQNWPLGDVFSGEEIIVDYSVEFAIDSAQGTYTNYAQVLGWTGSRQERYQVEYDSPIATDSIEMSNMDGEVLGISTDSCPQYLTTYMKSDQANDSAEVTKLQRFLNIHIGSNLDVTGEFDLLTEIAVRDFQLMYGDEILDPWGMDKDSGYVYFTTQKKINEIHCENRYDFPLSQNQHSEILAYRSSLSTETFASIQSSTTVVTDNVVVHSIGTPVPAAVIPRQTITFNNQSTTHITTTRAYAESPLEPYFNKFINWLSGTIKTRFSFVSWR